MKRSIKKLLYPLFALTLSALAHTADAQIEYNGYLGKSGIVPGATITVTDPDPTETGSRNWVERKPFLRLGYSRKGGSDVSSAVDWRYEVRIKFMNLSDTSQALTDTLVIGENDSMPSYSAARSYHVNWSSVRARVLSVCGSTGTSTACVVNPETYPFLPADIELLAGISRKSLSSFPTWYTLPTVSSGYGYPNTDCVAGYTEDVTNLKNSYNSLRDDLRGEIMTEFGYTESGVGNYYSQWMSAINNQTLNLTNRLWSWEYDMLTHIVSSGGVSIVPPAQPNPTRLVEELFRDRYVFSMKRLAEEGAATGSSEGAIGVRRAYLKKLGAELLKRRREEISLLLAREKPAYAATYARDFEARSSEAAKIIIEFIDIWLNQENEYLADMGSNMYDWSRFNTKLASALTGLDNQYRSDLRTLNEEWQIKCDLKNAQVPEPCEERYLLAISVLEERHDTLLDSIRTDMWRSYGNIFNNGQSFQTRLEPYTQQFLETCGSLNAALVTLAGVPAENQEAAKAALTETDTYQFEAVAFLYDALVNGFSQEYAPGGSPTPTVLQTLYNHQKTNILSTVLPLTYPNKQRVLFQFGGNTVPAGNMNTSAASYSTALDTYLTQARMAIDSSAAEDSLTGETWLMQAARFDYLKQQENLRFETEKSALFQQYLEFCPLDVPAPEPDFVFGDLFDYADKKVALEQKTEDDYFAALIALYDDLGVPFDLWDTWAGLDKSIILNEGPTFVTGGDQTYLDLFSICAGTGFDTLLDSLLLTPEGSIDSLFARIQAQLDENEAHFGGYYSNGADLGAPLDELYWQAQQDAALELIRERYRFILQTFREYVAAQNDSTLSACVDSLFINFQQADSTLEAEFRSLVNGKADLIATGSGTGYSFALLKTFVFRIGPGMFTFIRNKNIDELFLEGELTRPDDVAKRKAALVKPYGNNPISAPLGAGAQSGTGKALFLQSETDRNNRTDLLFSAVTRGYRTPQGNYYEMYPKGDRHMDWLVDSLIYEHVDTPYCVPSEIKIEVWNRYTSQAGLVFENVAAEFGDVYTGMATRGIDLVDDETVNLNADAFLGKPDVDILFLSRLLEQKMGAWNTALQEVLFANNETELLECAELIYTDEYLNDVWEHRQGIINAFAAASGMSVPEATQAVDVLEIRSRADAYERWQSRSLNLATAYETAAAQVFKDNDGVPLPAPRIGIDLPLLTGMASLTPVGEVSILTGPIYDASPTMQIVTENSACGAKRFITWNAIPNTTEYDLEWVYIDNEIRNAAGVSINTLPNMIYEVFRMTEPVRVSTKIAKYPVPEEYPNGKLYFRVRAVGRIVDNDYMDYDQPQYYPWSDYVTGYPVISTTVNFNGTNPYNTSKKNNLNWQWVSSFSEEGKFKKIINFYDGSNRSRQMLTLRSTDNTTLIGETLYDHEGRAAVEMMPYPEKCTNLSYRSNIRRDNTGVDIFDKDDFEPTAGNKQVSTAAGVSRYFSAQNPFLADDNPLLNMETIPDAAYYPYTRRVFLADNTMRLLAESSPGADYRIGSGHESKYLYGNATSTELYRLFGRNVGIASHYKKNATLDPNGQLSVSYVDQEGRTVATALAGDPPTNVVALPSYQPETLTVNLTDNTVYDEEAGTATISFNHINEISNNEYTFTYDYGKDIFTDPAFTSCIYCEFDLEIWVTDLAGNKLTLTNITGVSGQTSGDGVTMHIGALPPGQPGSCTEPGNATPNQITFKTVMPDISTYRVYKKLTWDKAKALEALKTALQRPGNTTSQNAYNTFYQQSINSIYVEDCNQFQYGNGALSSVPQSELRDIANTQCEPMAVKMTMQIRKNEMPGGTDNPNGIGKYFSDNAFWNKVNTLRISGAINYNSDPFTYINPDVIDPNMSANTLKASYPWPEEWEYELIKAHPEYCWYKKCRYDMGLDTKVYDIRMAQFQGLSAARAGGYMNPQNNAQTSIIPQMRNTGSPVSDVGFGWVKDKMLHLPDNVGGTIWKRGYAVYEGYYFENPPEATKDKAAWQIFRGQYLDLKQDYFYQETNSCKYIYNENLSNPASDPNYATAVVKKPVEPSSSEEMSNAQNSAQQVYSANSPMCGQMCSQNADSWLTQLMAPCIGNPENLTSSQYLDYVNIKINLYQYCMSRCGMPGTNPAGVITQAELDSAMTSQTGPLYNALTIYNNSFGQMPGCVKAVTQTGSSWTSPLTVASDFYVTTCKNVPCVGTSHADLMDILTKYNEARVQMYSECHDNWHRNTPFWTTNNDCSIQLMIPFVRINENCLAAARSLACSSPAGPCNSNFLNLVQNCSIDYYPQNSVSVMCRSNAVSVMFTQLNGNAIHPSLVNEVSAYELVTDQLPQGVVKYKALLRTSFFGTCVNNSTGEANKVAAPGTPFTLGYVVFSNLDGQCTKEVCVTHPKVTADNIYQEDCWPQLQDMAQQNANNMYEQWLEEQLSSVWAKMTCRLPENFRMQYKKSEHHYTLYYYDQAGNLTLTVPPEGVKPLTATAFNANGTWKGNYASTNWTYEPQHGMDSRYKFNSLNKNVETESPDGGFSKYYPDAVGRPVISVNRKQLMRGNLESTASLVVKYESYTLYDALGRITEVGEQKRTLNNAGVQQSRVRSQITRTEYDKQFNQPTQSFYGENTRGHVSRITFRQSEGNTYQHAYYYSYDIHGNIKTQLTEVPVLASFGRRYFRSDFYYDLISGKMNEVHYQRNQTDQFYYRYTYDADNRLTIAESSPDYYYWDKDAKYFYYPHGPLMRVETGEDKVQGSDFAYTIQGWLKSVNSGALNPEYDPGFDGQQTLGGNPHTQVARDAYGYVLDYYNGDYVPVGGNAVKNRPDVPTGSDYRSFPLQNGLYNGNIVRMTTALTSPDETILPVLGNGYRYDQLNRIVKHRTFEKSDMHASGQYSFAGVPEGTKWATDYTYDANGNLLSLKRYDQAGTAYMDNLTYTYSTQPGPGTTPGSEYNYSGKLNRLSYLADAVAAGAYPDDIDNQAANNYAYDEIGNLTRDTKEEIAAIEWTVHGKVKKITRTSGSKKPDLEFWYDANALRFMKVEKTKNQSSGALNGQQLWKYTYYQRGPQGNVLGIYEIKKAANACPYEMELAEQMLYGMNRLGIYRRKVKVGQSAKTLGALYGTVSLVFCELIIKEPSGPIVADPGGFDPTQPASVDSKVGANKEVLFAQQIHSIGRVLKPAGRFFGRPLTVETTPAYWERGRRQYEFTNHLNNVLITVSDLKKGMETGTPDGIVDYYIADVLTTHDYEPFGNKLTGRTLQQEQCSTYVTQDSVFVTNEGFDGPTLPSGWVFARASGAVSSGTFVINATSVFGNATFTPTGLLPSTTYTVKVWINVGTTTPSGVNVAIGGSVLSLISSPVTTSGYYSYTFTTNSDPSPGVQISFGNAKFGAAQFSIDNLKIFILQNVTHTDCSQLHKNEYRFGFNGQEKDNEVYGEANSYTADYWQYDPRVARRWEIDPMTQSYPWQSPYAAFNNSPIWLCDPYGLEADGGGGDPKTGQITATVYFRLDPDELDTYCNEEERQEALNHYITAYRNNVANTWNGVTYFNGTENVSVCVENVQFLPLPADKNDANLNPNENIVTVGTGTSAKPQSLENKISYVYGANKQFSYMYMQNGASEAAHEFGHHLGLSDRYIQGALLNTSFGYVLPGSRFTIPIFNINNDPVRIVTGGYNPRTNLMSNGGGTLSQMQLSLVFAPVFSIESEHNPADVSITVQRGIKPFYSGVRLEGIARDQPLLYKGTNFTLGSLPAVYINNTTGGLKDPSYYKKSLDYIRRNTM